MKRMIAVGICLLMLMPLALALAEQTPLATGENATVTVKGSAAVLVEPDYATINLGVVSRAATVAEAQEKNNQQMNALIEALKSLGIAEEDMQTSNLYINPEYNYEGGDGYYYDYKNPPSGYSMNNTLEVTVRDLANLSNTLDTGLQAGANQTYGFTFGSTKRDEAYDRAMQESLKEAQRKAEFIAGASGKRLGSLVSVQEQGSDYSGLYARSAVMDVATSTPIMNGMVSVEANLTVTYLLQ